MKKRSAKKCRTRTPIPGAVVPAVVLSLILSGCASGQAGSAAGSSSSVRAAESAGSFPADVTAESRASDEHNTDGDGAGNTDLISSPDRKSAAGADLISSADGSVTCDLSGAADGIISVSYTGTAERIRITLNGPDGSETPYPVTFSEPENDDETAPTYNAERDLSEITAALTGGSGSYRIGVQEYVPGTGDYAFIFSKTFDAEIADSFSPALLPNYYVNFSADDAVAEKAVSLTENSESDLEEAERIYDYVISNISYSQDEAAWVSSSHVPYPAETLSSGTGIASDFASLTAAMLRSRGIPARLVSGYSDDRFHTWVSVYLAEAGTIADTYTAAGNEWVLMDPAIGSANSASDVKDYVSDSSHYTAMYIY